MERLAGVVRNYEWGDPDFIPALTGQPSDGRPWAELWLGTHPDGTSTLVDGRALTDATGPLPYLLKVLAASEPLSLQAHPDAERARKGYAAGRYADPFPKPELLCALTPFDTLCGVRPVDRTLKLLDEIGATTLADVVRRAGAGVALAALYRGELDVEPIIAACERSPRPEACLVAELARMYPGDPSVAVTLVLNRVRLQPGEAIFLPAGNLHAYLDGAGVEIMGASDNVVRGGLTVKQVDVDELLAVVDPTPLVDPVLQPTTAAPGRFRYDAPNVGEQPPFQLWRLETAIAADRDWTAEGHELFLCTAGGDETWPQGVAIYAAPGEPVTLPRDSTIFIAGGRA